MLCGTVLQLPRTLGHLVLQQIDHVFAVAVPKLHNELRRYRFTVIEHWDDFL